MQGPVEPELHFRLSSSLVQPKEVHHRPVSKAGYKKLAYTVEEAAELLSLSRAHVYRLLDLQQIGSVTIGRSRRITVNQLTDFISDLEKRGSVHRFRT